MLPATLAQEVRKQVLHYLQATFRLRDRSTEKALEAFFNDPENGLFKGPWVQVRRPFRLDSGDISGLFDIEIPYVPFRHQATSWRRLTTRGGNQPLHTLVTTGTGSGKTECFLYPVLDHCLRMHQAGKRDGIKAIILYPMNALAADQAGRFAEEILKSPLLSDMVAGKPRARVRVGLYTGRMSSASSKEEGAEPGTYAELTREPAQDGGGEWTYKAITNREAMQADPPDILLTNYKMLDYLLLRPKDVSIWQHNQADPSLLRYLVLDELHTYDGAQGADVACLIRRLKERFSIPRGQLCMVGTSATVAGGDDESNLGPLHKLCQFASTLFEESITDEAVIQEDRYRVDEVVRVPELEVDVLPSAGECEPQHREDSVRYAYRMASLFGGPSYPVEADDPRWPNWTPHYSALRETLAELDDHTRWGVALGEWIRRHPLFQRLLVATEDAPAHWLELLRDLAREDYSFRSVGDLAQRGEVLMGFMALVAQARELRSGKAFPLVPTQVQLWLRELRRIGALVHEEPAFAWLDNPVPEGRHQLPVVHCTECGELAWVGLRDLDADASIEQHGVRGLQLADEVLPIYDAWGFEGHPRSTLVILSPWREGDDPIHSGGQQELEGLRWHLSPSSLVLREGPGPCPLTGERTFPVKVVHEHDHRDNGQRIGVRRCPHCRTLDSLMFIGSRAATIASVAIDEVFGSVLNSDPKLLAFTDSVQDASHRAGFFSARTYHFTLRTALQHLIDDVGEEGLPLADVGERLLAFWAEPETGRPGNMKEAMATLIPPDLREYSDYLDYRNSGARMPPTGLFAEVAQRLTWEATSEFSLMLTHGRTMERHASAALGWESHCIDATLTALRQRFPRIAPRLEDLTDEALRLWVLGMLHRQRERGGLHHPYLMSFARQNYWGKYPFGKVVKGRETFPPQGRYQPRLWTTHPDKRHDHILAPPRDGQMPPWQLVWARRVLGLPGVDDATLVDLLAAFLEAGETAGLLRKLHQDGEKAWYGISDVAARLYPEGEKLLCNSSGYYLYRPPQEAALWRDAPSLSYQDDAGRYDWAAFSKRENYYRTRYRKGALRRVFAHEHTGLLDTPEREGLEASFNDGAHADDPNVLTATSTLEMGIDIGDLSTTMLCSIPPSAASYLQRIGRAGRKTGTALILSVINQRPHDLFFYARPEALLAGEIEPPGCWLDASAVLVRQYLAFCFDQAVREGVLADLPGTGKQLVDEVIQNRAGHIPGLLAWVLEHEAALQQRFIARFALDAMDDTRERFLGESRTERLREAIERAASEFQLQRQLLDNARKRLRDQKSKLEPATEAIDHAEIEREERILRARQRKLNEVSALEVLTEHGLLPNYAFPERGVRFSGAIYHRRSKGEDGEVIETRPPIELVRSGPQAIRELAPGNQFYTHSHRFAIQQIELGSRNQPLMAEWAICGQCGHMRHAAEVQRPEAVPACPQCGHDGPESQTDLGQQRNFLQFARSQAVSYMEYYDSLSADKGEERENERYQLVTSFDQTVEQASGAVGNDTEPFGIEYRSAMVMRQVNAGYQGQYRDLAFGQEKVSSEGFLICADCGMAADPGQGSSEVRHRRSCSGHRESQRRHREGRKDDAYRWEHVYLYRELRSEAVRLLLPDVEPEDVATLEAAIYLGMRLRFQGDPGHLLVQQQLIPNLKLGVTQHYLVLMDAVPGGTGFLKALFQEVDEEGRAGEGMVDVLRRALAALEHCPCRELHQTDDDTDGCYRCLRTYHLQYRADQISREQGIRLLRRLIAAGETRESKKELDEIKPRAMFGSVLEKRFVNHLRDWVVERGREDDWRDVLIGGTRGFEFTLGDGRIWSLQLQPLLGAAQGVSIACQPDFLLRADDDVCRPIAIFLDGFEFHVKPHEAESRLADDFLKRRAILDSQRYWVWSLSWDDLDQSAGDRFRFLSSWMTDDVLVKWRNKMGASFPQVSTVAGDAFTQFKGFLVSPHAEGWQRFGQVVGGFALMRLASSGIGQEASQFNGVLSMWRAGYSTPPLGREDRGDWAWIGQNLALTEDLMVYGLGQELLLNDYTNLTIELRLDDSEQERSAVETFRLRWRRFHALTNLFQFLERMLVYTTSEFESGVIPEPSLMPEVSLDDRWQEIVEETLSSLEKLVRQMAARECEFPEVEHYSDDLGDEPFAELAWPTASPPVAILVGDQASFSAKWHQAGWKVITDTDMQTRGESWCVEQLPKRNSGDD